MENKQIALSDVERNKELFEYEMTEVILQLKGEFAKVSGRDMKLDDAQLAAPSIRIGDNIPSVSIENVSLDLLETETIDSDKLALPEITITKTSVDCPAVPTVEVAPIGKIKVDKTQLDCPTANVSVKADMEKVKLELPGVQAFESDIKIPQIDSDTAIEVENLSHFDIPLPSAKVDYIAHDVEIQQIAIDIPNAGTNVNSNIPVVSADVSVDIPTVSAIGAYSGISIDVQNTPNMDVSPKIPNHTQYTLAEVEVKMPIIDVADTSVEIGSGTKKVVLQEVKINVPTINKIDIAVIDPVTTKSAAISLSSVQKCHVPMPEQIILSKISLDDDDIVPSVKVSSGTDTVVKIDRTIISYENTTVHSVPLPDVDIQKVSNISVPEMPDFSDAMREVLESAV